MESAIHDLVRELDPEGGSESRPLHLGASGRPRIPELEVEVEVVDDLLLDPWFWRSEEEIAAIEDDPTAKIIEIRIEGYGTGFDDRRWAF